MAESMAEPPPPITTLVDWLDDLSVRFLLNLPKSELSSVPRLCFQVEEAQWFYEDFVRPAVAASGAQPLPSLPLRQFCMMLFQHCPLLSGYNDAQHIAAYEEFLAYKVRVPVRGAILLDESMEKVVLVRGWKKGSSWSFPRGKINKDEKDLDCAIREVYEETGYDVRAANLVPADESEAKYIDITMREQHMRLFVFRGVSEDTHFEPKTRKEISKISWYAIRDLPGFKKQKHGQVAGDATSANKFYMVAPFLGQLKKWIGLQRKKDAAQPRHVRMTSDGLGMQTATEDEGETEEVSPEPVPVPVMDRRSEDLKSLLSIGGGDATPVPDNSQKNDLLAMLRGSAQPAQATPPPQTPFEQINAFAKEPATPHPDHLRRPSIPSQQQPPQYGLPPSRIPQEQHWNYSLPTPQIFGPGPQFGGYPPIQQQGFPGMLPPHLQQQQLQQRQSVPNVHLGPPNNRPCNAVSGQQAQPSLLPFQQQQQVPPVSSNYGSNVYMAQGPQGAIASGPSVPNASQLPAPRLNANQMNLLNAFKLDHKPTATPPPAAAQLASRHGSTHQAALLDLFRKPSAPQESTPQPTPTPPVEQPVSPTLTDVTEKPRPPKQARKPTLNEITRTLPLKPKVKSPPPPSVAAAPSARPASGQLFDPNATKPSVTASGQGRPQQQKPAISVLQRPASGQGTQPAPAKPQPPPAQQVPTKPKTNGTAPAPFTILARPTSRGLKSPSQVAPPSPLRNQTPHSSSPFQPQLLKRPKEGETAADTAPAAEVEEPRTSASKSTGDGQKDHLLALFGKPSTPAVSAPVRATPPVSVPSPSPAPPTTTQSQTNGQRNALLDLLKSPTATSSTQPTTTPTPAAPTPAQSHPSLSPAPQLQPPSAPRLSPSRTPSSTSQSQQQKIHPIRQPLQPPPNHHHQGHHSTSRSTHQQNLLLDIFTRPGSSASQQQQNKRTATPPILSPGTPISPFTLGTPAQMQGLGFGGGGGGAAGSDKGRGFGSMASAARGSSGVGSGDGAAGEKVDGEGKRKGSAVETPVDAKDREFLLGFLKGVVGEGEK